MASYVSNFASIRRLMIYIHDNGKPRRKARGILRLVRQHPRAALAVACFPGAADNPATGRAPLIDAANGDSQR